jgi:phage nucleotide-binding protein
MKFVKAVVYGETGTGKTSSALTLPPEKTLIIANEKGLLPLAGKDFTVWEIDSWEDLLQCYQELLKPENKEKYKIVFIDSLTELNELCKEFIVKKERIAKKIDIGKLYDELMTQQDYQLLDSKMRKMIRSFRDLEYHIVFTASEATEKDELTGMIVSIPGINGKLAKELGGYFDEMFRLITKEEEKGKPHARYFLTGKTDRTKTKDRSGVLEFYERVDWTGIIGRIMAKYEKEEVKQEVA